MGFISERLEAEEGIFEIRSNVTYGRNKRSFNSSAWRSRYLEFPKSVQERALKARAQVLRCLGKQMLEWNHMIGSRKLKLSSRSCTVTEIVRTHQYLSYFSLHASSWSPLYSSYSWRPAWKLCVLKIPFFATSTKPPCRPVAVPVPLSDQAKTSQLAEIQKSRGK